MFHIYGLYDPRDLMLRYVGCSINPNKRIATHISEARRDDNDSAKALWIRSVLEDGILPQFVVMSSYETGEIASLKEYIWIVYLKAVGVPLLNSEIYIPYMFRNSDVPWVFRRPTLNPQLKNGVMAWHQTGEKPANVGRPRKYEDLRTAWRETKRKQRSALKKNRALETEVR